MQHGNGAFQVDSAGTPRSGQMFSFFLVLESEHCWYTPRLTVIFFEHFAFHGLLGDVEKSSVSLNVIPS